jgi:hypothetical protein
MAISSSLDPPASREGAVLFDDEAHLRASHLLALARGRPAWFHAALEEADAGDPLAALAAPERRDVAHSVLLRLAREDALAEVVASRPALAVAVFASALGFDAGRAAPMQDESTGRAAINAPVERAVIAELAATSSRWPPLAPAARSLALRVHAAALLDAGLDAAETIALAAAVFQNIPAPSVEPAHAPQKEAVHAAHERQEDRGTKDVDAFAGESASEQFVPIVSTRCGGIFYLLDRVQELDLGESLWKACLPEGLVLAAAMSAVLGPRFAGDRAPALFGGVDAATTCPDVTPEQHAEVAIATCAALAAALPRRGLAATPPALLALVRHPAGRLLVAAAEGFPFAFFAWPALTPEMVRGGLDGIGNQIGRASCRERV